MPNVYKIAALLYGTERHRSLVCCPTLSVGRTNGTVKSACRPAGASSDAKVSLIAVALDTMLTETERRAQCALAELDDGMVYAEFSSEQAVLRGNRLETTIRLTPVGIAMLLLAQALVQAKNTELCQIFRDAVTEYNATGKVSESRIYMFCDSYYFGNVKKSGAQLEQVDVDKETLEAYVRSSHPSNIPELKGTAVAKPVMVALKKKAVKKTAPDSDLDVLMKDCKAGKYRIGFKWESSQEEYVQPLHSLEGYIPNKEFRSILKKIKFRTDKVLARMQSLDLAKGQDRVAAIGKDYINLTLSGKPGTGKTKLAYMLAAATGLPIYTVSNSHNTDEDEFEGKTKMIDGKAVSVETDTLKCVENGGILLLEEINLVNAAVAMGALGQLVEFPFLIKKFGYEPVRRHPLCIIITTMNTGTAGSKSMSQPFANRFKQSFVLNDPEKEDFIRILMSSTGAGRDVCRWVYDCYERITGCIEEDNGMADVESILLSLSMRSCAGAIENIQEGMEPKDAIRNSIIGKVAEQDREVAESCSKVLSSMRDPDFDMEDEEE